MTNLEVLKHNIGLILGLGVIALIRPIMKITGIMDIIGQQLGSILMTVIISMVWIFIVVKKKSPYLIRILVFAGISYAVFAIILSGILSPILHGELQGPLTNPFAIISVLVTNIIWGLILGLIAWALTKLINRQ